MHAIGISTFNVHALWDWKAEYQELALTQFTGEQTIDRLLRYARVV